MIVAFSTSSPIASVALLGEDGEKLAWMSAPAERNASTRCLELLDALLGQTSRSLTEVTLFAADLGPGSFTGTRVGVALAKSLAFVHGSLATGASAFDLISPTRVVALPSRKGEFFVRIPGAQAVRSHDVPEDAIGFGFGRDDLYPEAVRFADIIHALPRLDPFRLVPEYLMEPSISQPKKPFASRGPGG